MNNNNNNLSNRSTVSAELTQVILSCYMSTFRLQSNKMTTKTVMTLHLKLNL